ncbi:SDR family oxidoreductase [Arthrobacter agilis]|uniref:SDR family oxidoreductase n=1 Tax=Arthrobacter agilis TaxID=37921 RepID=UPI000B34D2A8|nr:SDR family oxidoreductase [Arthrobacter agilis]OUM44734.1 NAD-dependent dehydratase [Arthrobacter agilis]PPB47059.1 NAD-dependent dehydratase [Arthrobacter agilis]TPV22473.1 SDR family oxidoreductase [Arthrobacter agilis]VDR32285.1 NAD dependent epimerase/dehydratase, LLPSF_EDH_00030 family [Arthrobacter agilis]
MQGLKVLFIGGSGTISAHCTAAAVDAGMDVYLLNRGIKDSRPVPEGVTTFVADSRDKQAVLDALGDHSFDCVVSWVNFTPEHVQQDIEIFAGRTEQYVFISSASAYQTPPTHLPVLESTPLKNPFWEYSRNKIACEDLLTAAYREQDFPVTIVRPSHTYDETLIPFDGGWTVVERMRAGRPVIVPGDGTSLWTITHSRDFAKGFTGLLGHSHAIGEAVHITGHETPSWNQIYLHIAAAAGVPNPHLVHVASDSIAEADPEWGAGLLGDKSHTMIFDNTKIRSLVPGFTATIPFDQGAREMIAWHDADPTRRVVDPHIDALMDRLAATYAPRSL